MDNRLVIAPEHRDRRAQRDQYHVVREQCAGINSTDRRVSPALVHVLSDLKSTAEERTYNGMAAVMLQNNGDYELVVVGEAARQPVLTIGMIQRLIAMLNRMMDSPPPGAF